MDKLDMKTNDITDQNIEKISKLFPNTVKEGVIDFDLLKQELSDVLVEGGEERYRLDWPGKRASILKANTPINKTLRPVKEESVDFENTENLYIEGDNFEVLKILQESYLNKVKMIYIDPPYNTGKDFVYRDNFKQDNKEYNEEVNAVDEEGNKLFKNTETNGRFHSDWLSMMYERLTVARDLLRDDGVVFISIDDNEVDNLKKICHEIFGEYNFLECIIWKKRATPPNDRNIGRIHEFILCYAKNIESVNLGLLPRDEKSIARYSNPDNDKRGPWAASDLSANGKGGRLVESCVYGIKNPTTDDEHLPSEGRCWLFNNEKMERYLLEGRVAFRQNTGAPFLKRYLSEVRQGLTLPTILTEFGFSSTSAAELDKLFTNKGIFEYAKPTTLIKPLLKIGLGNITDGIVLDFFAGSATTAHAIMQLNTEDGENRKFIMTQLPEETARDSEAYKAGYKNIADIGKERIRRAAKKIREDNKNKDLSSIDFGFRVYKTDSSNMKDVYYNPKELGQDKLAGLESNIKEDRSPEDILNQVILDLGLELSLKIEEKDIVGNKVFFVADNSLVACFDEDINFEIVDEIAKIKPLKVVFADASFKDDKDRINVEERFKRLSSETIIKVL